MKKSYILSLAVAAVIASGCSKENGFDNRESGEGQFLKSALSMDINAQELENTRAAVDADINNFNVILTQVGHSEPYAKYIYGEMPEVITLPAGTYTVTATYGENRLADWENPYFLGVSDKFEVTPYEICSYVDPIECRLENIKVTVDFDSSLRSAMSEDSYVEVKVGSSTSLNYGLAEADSKKAGFFKHSDEISLVAVFRGYINGQETVETKSLSSIQKGNHYKILFSLHNGNGPQGSGNINGDVTVDANVTIVDVTRDVEIGDDPLLDDSERPTEGNSDDNPDDPKTETPPAIEGANGINLDVVHNGNDYLDKEFVINIESKAKDGISGFTVKIVSDLLTKEELENSGLTDVLDLVNPGECREALQALGLLVKLDADGNKIIGTDGEPVPEDTYRGYKKIKFDLGGFMSMLKFVGSAYHEFVLTVTDANGTTSKTVKIQM